MGEPLWERNTPKFFLCLQSASSLFSDNKSAGIRAEISETITAAKKRSAIFRKCHNASMAVLRLIFFCEHRKASVIVIRPLVTSTEKKKEKKTAEHSYNYNK